MEFNILKQALKSKGFKSFEELRKDELLSRQRNKDLAFIGWKTLYKLEKRHKVFNDELAIGTEKGLYTSLSLLESNGNLPNFLSKVWDSKNQLWYVREVVDVKKSKDLLSLIDEGYITPIDEKFTELMITLTSMEYNKSFKVLKKMIDNIIYENSEEVCDSVGIEFDSDRYKKVVKIGKEVISKLEELECLL